MKQDINTDNTKQTENKQSAFLGSLMGFVHKEPEFSSFEERMEYYASLKEK